MTPYGDINLGQHRLRQWLVAWRHQAITWTNVDLSSVRSSGIHLRAILQEIPQPSVTEINLKITYLKLCSNFPGVNELTHNRLLKFPAMEDKNIQTAQGWNNAAGGWCNERSQGISSHCNDFVIPWYFPISTPKGSSNCLASSRHFLICTQMFYELSLVEQSYYGHCSVLGQEINASIWV